jgi:hypothetical protein
VNTIKDNPDRYQLLVEVSTAPLPDELAVALWPPAQVEAWLRQARALYADFDSGEIFQNVERRDSLRLLLEGLDDWTSLVEPYCPHPEDDEDLGSWTPTMTNNTQVHMEIREVYCTLCDTAVDYQERDALAL